jgi:hypothetical protein
VRSNAGFIRTGVIALLEGHTPTSSLALLADERETVDGACARAQLFDVGGLSAR